MPNKLILFFALLYQTTTAQPTLQWKNCYGGSDGEEAQCIAATKDKGVIVAGFTASNDGQVSNWHGGTDFWVVKLDSIGNIEWQKALGGTKTEFAYGIIQDDEGNYVITGESNSSDGDVGNNLGNEDLWVVKLSSTGNIIWKKVFGGSGREVGNTLVQTTDGGYLVAGYTSSSDGNVAHLIGGTDFWVLKLSSGGDLEWEKTYGGTSGDIAKAVIKSHDGGYLIGGRSSSTDGDIVGNHGNTDCWLIKISNDGVLEWQKAMGGIGTETIRSISPTPDGGYAVVGETGSGNSGQVSGVHGGFEVWVVKLDSVGNIEWQKPFGGSGDDLCNGILCTTDGKLVIAGTTRSKDGDVVGGVEEYQAWMFETSLSGMLEWQMPLGGSEIEDFYCVAQTADGGFCFAGATESSDGDVTGNHGFRDVWVVKVAPETTGIQPIKSNSLVIYPNPTSDKIFFPGTLDGAVRYEIRNSVGCLLKSGILSAQNGIQVQDLPVGIYGVSLVSVYGQRFFGRFLIQR